MFLYKCVYGCGYTYPEKLSDEQLQCGKYGKPDSYIGEFNSDEELNALLKSSGLKWVYPYEVWTRQPE